MSPSLLDSATLWETPAPVLFNPWKHHLGFLRWKLSQHAADGEAGLRLLADEIVVLGGQLMDLYFGLYSPNEIAERAMESLRAEGRFDPDPFRDWVESQGGYGMIPFPDGSQWVLRFGEGIDRYIHIHPGRWIPQTVRVRANVLKTAILVVAACQLNGDSPTKLTTVNRVRQEYLNLAPMGKHLKADEGLGAIIDLLKEPS
jgi:hypothetical protein